MLPSLSVRDGSAPSQSRRTIFTTSQQRAGSVTATPSSATPQIQPSPPLTQKQPSFADCNSVEKLLGHFATAHHTLPSANKGGCNAGVGDVCAALPQPPPLWNTSGMLHVRKTITAHLTETFIKTGRGAAGEHLPAASFENFLLFLVVGAQDLLRAVRQQTRTAAISDGAVQKVKQNATCNDAVFEREKLCRDDGSLERDALAYLTRCAAYLALQQQQRTLQPSESVQTRTTSFLANAEESNSTVSNSNGENFMFGACSALTLLQNSVSAASTAHAAAAAARAPPSSTHRHTPYWCSTGCDGLDRALGGAGFRSGWVTEVYGEAGAGKTQLGLQTLLEQSATDLCHSAVALCLTHYPPFRALLEQSPHGVAQRCREIFATSTVDAARCALVYLVSEDVPTSRLGPLASAAARRAVRRIQLHPLLGQLPADVVEAVLRGVRQTCTATMVLTRLQIRHVASLQEVLRLVEPVAASSTALREDSTISSTLSMTRSSSVPSRCSLSAVVEMWGGALGRALVVFDSAAAAVVAGQSDLHGEVRTDVSVAAAATELRRAAAKHNWCVVVANQVRAVPSAVRNSSHSLMYPRRKRARSAAAAAPVSPADFSSSNSASVGSTGTTMVPALGFAWSAVAQCRVYLRKSLSLGVRQLVLRHSPAHPPAQVSFIITQNGIEDA